MTQNDIYDLLKKEGRQLTRKEIAEILGVRPQTAGRGINKLLEFRVVKCDYVIDDKTLKFKRVIWVDGE